jgi:LmbE family N-acetylglucosaminyl deacetylase
MRALFIFAHQDDEIAAAARIGHLVRGGAEVYVAYLTDGQGRNATSVVRDEESRCVLKRLGVDLTRVAFLGSEHGIPDGRLVEHLDEALALVEDWAPATVDEIWCLSWEGGHQDHDASHLVALAFADRRGLVERVHEVPLYQGFRLRGPLFQTLKPLPVGGPWTAREIGLREGFRIASLCRHYTSQRTTWLGLLPAAMIRLVFGHKEWSRPASVRRVQQKPHDGMLFYERRFRVPWAEFDRHARPFIDRFSGSDAAF